MSILLIQVLWRALLIVGAVIGFKADSRQYAVFGIYLDKFYMDLDVILDSQIAWNDTLKGFCSIANIERWKAI